VNEHGHASLHPYGIPKCAKGHRDGFLTDHRDHRLNIHPIILSIPVKIMAYDGSVAETYWALQ
jgi:hypothetical protein